MNAREFFMQIEFLDDEKPHTKLKRTWPFPGQFMTQLSMIIIPARKQASAFGQQ